MRSLTHLMLIDSEQLESGEALDKNFRNIAAEEIERFRRDLVQRSGDQAVGQASTMHTYWIPGVNNLGNFGRWAFAEFTEVFQIESDFEQLVETRFKTLIEETVGEPDG